MQKRIQLYDNAKIKDIICKFLKAELEVPTPAELEWNIIGMLKAYDFQLEAIHHCLNRFDFTKAGNLIVQFDVDTNDNSFNFEFVKMCYALMGRYPTEIKSVQVSFS